MMRSPASRRREGREQAAYTGEWPGGISPPGSRRTGQELLSSPGSHCPAFGQHAQPPVRKEFRLASCDAHQPLFSPPPVAVQSFVLPLGPSHEILVDATEKRMQPSLVKASVVVDP